MTATETESQIRSELATQVSSVIGSTVAGPAWPRCDRLVTQHIATTLWARDLTHPEVTTSLEDLDV